MARDRYATSFKCKHPFTDANSYMQNGKYRVCKTCIMHRQRLRRASL